MPIQVYRYTHAYTCVYALPQLDPSRCIAASGLMCLIVFGVGASQRQRNMTRPLSLSLSPLAKCLARSLYLFLLLLWGSQQNQKLRANKPNHMYSLALGKPRNQYAVVNRSRRKYTNLRNMHVGAPSERKRYTSTIRAWGFCKSNACARAGNLRNTHLRVVCEEHIVLFRALVG